MALEDDLRHAQNNNLARQSVIDKIGPSVKECFLLNMEMNEEQFREWRNHQHRQQDDRMRMKKNFGEIAMETAKWAIVSGLTATVTYLYTHGWLKQG